MSSTQGLAFPKWSPWQEVSKAEGRSQTLSPGLPFTWLVSKHLVQAPSSSAFQGTSPRSGIGAKQQALAHGMLKLQVVLTQWPPLSLLLELYFKDNLFFKSVPGLLFKGVQVFSKMSIVEYFSP